MEGMKGEYITMAQAAELLSVSESTIRRAFDKGELSGFRIPGSNHRRVLRAEIERILEQGKNRNGQEKK